MSAWSLGRDVGKRKAEREALESLTKAFADVAEIADTVADPEVKEKLKAVAASGQEGVKALKK